MSIACAVSIAAMGFVGRSPVSLPHAMGFVFALYTLATRTIAGRHKDLSTLVLAGVGGSFGFWFPWLSEIFVEVVDVWAKSEIISPAIAERLAMPLTIGVAGAMTSALLFVGTGSDRVLMTCGGATLVAAILPAAPIGPLGVLEPNMVLGVSAVVWNAIVCFGVCAWSVESARRYTRNACPFCGTDLSKSASPICPRCKRMPTSAGPLFARDRDDHARQNAALRQMYGGRSDASLPKKLGRQGDDQSRKDAA